MRSCLWIQDLRDEVDISFCLASLHFSRWQSLISLENGLPIDSPVGSLSYRDPCLPHREQGTLADQSRHWLENLNPELSGSWMLLRLNPSQDITESFPVRPLQLAPFLCSVLGKSCDTFLFCPELVKPELLVKGNLDAYLESLCCSSCTCRPSGVLASVLGTAGNHCLPPVGAGAVLRTVHASSHLIQPWQWL